MVPFQSVGPLEPLRLFVEILALLWRRPFLGQWPLLFLRRRFAALRAAEGDPAAHAHLQEEPVEQARNKMSFRGFPKLLFFGIIALRWRFNLYFNRSQKFAAF